MTRKMSTHAKEACVVHGTAFLTVEVAPLVVEDENREVVRLKAFWFRHIEPTNDLPLRHA